MWLSNQRVPVFAQNCVRFCWNGRCDSCFLSYWYYTCLRISYCDETTMFRRYSRLNLTLRQLKPHPVQKANQFRRVKVQMSYLLCQRLPKNKVSHAALRINEILIGDVYLSTYQAIKWRMSYIETTFMWLEYVINVILLVLQRASTADLKTYSKRWKMKMFLCFPGSI